METKQVTVYTLYKVHVYEDGEICASFVCTSREMADKLVVKINTPDRVFDIKVHQKDFMKTIDEIYYEIKSDGREGIREADLFTEEAFELIQKVKSYKPSVVSQALDVLNLLG